jgi:hypothetical protein
MPASAPPPDKIKVGVATGSLLVTALTGFASAFINAAAGGPATDTITAASVGAATLITMAVGRYGQAIKLHGTPLGIAKIIDRLLDEKLKERP